MPAKYSLWSINIVFCIIFMILPSFTIGIDIPVGSKSLGKTLFLLFSISIIAVLYLVIFLFKKDSNFLFKLSLIDGVIAILVLFVLINSTLFQNHLSVNYRLYDFGGLIFFYLAVRLIDSKGLILSFVFLVIGGLIQVTYGELQLYNFYPALNPNFPITGSFFNPGPYSGYLTAVFPIALGLHFFIDQWKCDDITPYRNLIKIMGIVTALGVILVLSVTASRAAWIALVFSGGFLMFFRFCWNRKFRKALDTPIKRTIGILLGLAIVAGVGTGLYYLKKDSADGRTLIWKASWEMIRENPLTGLGFDRFQAGY
ncbi:MAG: O-antigen ligase family protein, partial [Cyclobacterium sp.]|uniref:O-antigen ligase family protein n=1 Tax=Cyclobacterium sp. TaxID=1966343 RepID=UPI0039707E2C